MEKYVKLSDVYLMFARFDQENGEYPEHMFEGESMQNFLDESIKNRLISIYNKE